MERENIQDAPAPEELTQEEVLLLSATHADEKLLETIWSILEDPE